MAAVLALTVLLTVFGPSVPSAAAVAAPARPAPGAPVGARAPLWSWPVPAPHPVVRPFVAPATPYSAGHRGIDVASPVGTEITAPQDGRVVFAARIADRGVLAIEHTGGVRSSFEPVTPLVHAGEAVRRGQPVAVVATGGRRAEGTLYIGARVHGAYVSPLLLLGGLQRAVLLPMD